MTGVRPTIQIRDLKFAYPGTPTLLHVASLVVNPGERVLIIGRSGSGKTTLLNLIAGVIRADAGELLVLGRDQTSSSAAERDRWRADHIGLIFQQFNLLPYLNLLDNVTLPCEFSQRRAEQVRAQGGVVAAARVLLAAFGLDEQSLAARSVDRLSVGQQQRVAAARALIGAPDLVIADEPTSALDELARDEFFKVLFEVCSANQASILCVSHDRSIASQFDRVLHIADNQLNEFSSRP